MSHRPPSSGPSASDAEDRRALEACLAGRAGGWEAFVDRFAGLFASVADRSARRRGLPLPAADRDDVVADVMLECLRDDAAPLRAFAGRSSLASYLVVIARRVVIRRLVRDAAALRPVPGPGAAEPATADDVPNRVEDREQIAALLDRLEPAEARLVRLHHLEGRSYGEISRLTALPLGSIGPALSRARGKLRSMMDVAPNPGYFGGPITTDGSARSTGS